MAKINFSSLFQTPLHKFTYFFIFGNDPIVFERAISFLQKTFSCPLEIKTEADLLRPSASQASLFNEGPEASLTLVSQVTDKVINHLSEGIFIFTSTKARATSKLVTHFTSAPRSLAIAAYASPLTTPEFESMIGGMTLDDGFKRDLFKAYQNDYMGLLGELQKIKLFGEVPKAHYESFLGNQSSTEDFTPLREAFLLKNAVKTTALCSTLTTADLIPFLRGLARSFLTLFELMPYKNAPKTIPWQKITPPIFFKDQPLFESALSRWTTAEVQTFLEVLLFLEQKIKYAGFTLPQVLREIVSRETIS